jgi:hypothetical protein
MTAKKAAPPKPAKQGAQLVPKYIKPRFSNRDLSMIVTHQTPPPLALPFLMDTNRNAQ